MMFEKIFVEEKIIDHPKVEFIKSKFPNSEIRIISKVEDVFGRVKKPYLQKRTNLNLYVKPGFNLMKLNFYGPSSPSTTDAQFNKTAFKFGIELEHILPFNKGKWALFIEPTYNSINAQDKSDNGVADIEVKYSYLEFNLGAKHYMHINPSSKVFLSSFRMSKTL